MLEWEIETNENNIRNFTAQANVKGKVITFKIFSYGKMPWYTLVVNHGKTHFTEIFYSFDSAKNFAEKILRQELD